MNFRIPPFKIPDFPLGGLTISILGSIGLLLTLPDIPPEIARVWEVVLAGSVLLWAAGAGVLDSLDGQAEDAIQQKATRRQKRNPPEQEEEEGVSPNFSALIDAIVYEGEANRNEEQREEHRKALREIATIALVFFTLIAVIWQVGEMIKVYKPIRDQAKAASEQAESAAVANRAWISPGIVSIEEQQTQPLKIRIIYEDIGRTPALSAEFHARVRTINSNNGVPIPPQVYANVNFGDNLSCETTDKSYIGVVYQSANRVSTSGFVINDSSITLDKITKVITIIAIQGCYRYKTLGEWHWSKFCSFLEPSMDKPVEQWNFKTCADGSDAN